jgi:hypothetical protein
MTCQPILCSWAFLNGNAYDYHALVNDQANAPAAMRRASDRVIRSLERYDFDLDGSLYDNQPIDVVDCDDVRATPGDTMGHLERAGRCRSSDWDRSPHPANGG